MKVIIEEWKNSDFDIFNILRKLVQTFNTGYHLIHSENGWALMLVKEEVGEKVFAAFCELLTIIRLYPYFNGDTNIKLNYRIIE